MSKNVKEISGEELKELVAAGETVVCDFWATWCGPCRMLAPVLDAVAAQYADRARFVKVDVDENGEIAQELGVMSIPDIIVFADGKVKANHLGFAPEATLRAFLDENI